MGAHSAGGVAVTSLMLNDYGEEFCDRVRGIAFTDSVHDFTEKCPSFFKDTAAHARGKKTLKEKACNWIASKEKLDTVRPDRQCPPCISSGHEKHVYTSASAMPSVFPFLDYKLA